MCTVSGWKVCTWFRRFAEEEQPTQCWFYGSSWLLKRPAVVDDGAGATVRLETWAPPFRMNTVKTASIAASITSRRFVFRAEISFRTKLRLVESLMLAFTLNS